jgi:glycosyltransferase involved in cell wall biosynthesis
LLILQISKLCRVNGNTRMKSTIDNTYRTETDIAVSVIIPTFNRIDFLYPTLVCLFNQKTDFFYDIVVVDSGTDRTEQVMTQLQFIYGPYLVYVKSTESKNRSLLRNKGAVQAKGQLLIFLDNDMLVPPDFVQGHYNEQKKCKNCVLLGKRKSLTTFDYAEIGEDYLTNHFDLLGSLPWYRDVREQYLDDKGISLCAERHPWRYLFSHNFSITKETFLKSGGFDEKFGDNWGYEDIELGFRLFLNGTKFELSDTLTGYHQTHFEQTRSAQKEGAKNLKLFLSLHNCFDFELHILFYPVFNEIYSNVLQVKENCFTGRDIPYSAFPLILGCLWTAEERKTEKDGYLGICLPFIPDGIYNRLLILNTFYELPEEVRICILIEALRISRETVYLEKLQTTDEKIIEDCARKAGLQIQREECGKYHVLKLIQKVLPAACSILLPDSFTPAKRFSYLSLAHALSTNGFNVVMRDSKCTADFEGEDYRLNDETLKELSTGLEKPCGLIPIQNIFSEDIYGTDIWTSLAGGSAVVIRDADYESVVTLPSELRLDGMRGCNRNILEAASYITLHNELLGREDDSFEDEKKITICSSMENGYQEDGIDLFLETIAEMKGWYGKIKISEYEKLGERKFPNHNEASKYTKNYSLLQKYTGDILRLKQKIVDLNISDRVTLVQKNMSVSELADFVRTCTAFVFIPRHIVPSPLFYVSILLEKTPVIASHVRIGEEFYPFCIRIPSSEVRLTTEFSLPVSSENNSYTCGRIDKNALKSALQNPEICKADKELLISAEKEKFKNCITIFEKPDGARPITC